MTRHLGPETAKGAKRRESEGFNAKFLSGVVLDIGYRGGDPHSVPVTETAIGVELDYPGYDGKHLPFDAKTCDGVFASHCLEHIEDYKVVLADWYRVLRIGGYLVIAVPHRDLYERKATLPSRFNGDHKRFYTPSSLLKEVEDSLPIGGYRIRSLKDVDDDFNYKIAPEQHAGGSYEIELVIQKIEIPRYATCLRPSLMEEETNMFISNLVVKLLNAQKEGREKDAVEISEFLRAHHLPPFAELLRLVKTQNAPSIDGVADNLQGELKTLLVPILSSQPINEDTYIQSNKDVAESVERHGRPYAQSHYAHHGYFEGRPVVFLRSS